MYFLFSDAAGMDLCMKSGKIHACGQRRTSKRLGGAGVSAGELIEVRARAREGTGAGFGECGLEISSSRLIITGGFSGGHDR
jgi:hypothetical protein